MRINSGIAIAILCGVFMGGEVRVDAQGTPPVSAGGSGPGNRRPGGFVPGQKRPPGDPAQIERGKTLYDLNCSTCHGSDLRGGDKGGPNLLRSQLALSDKNGELIVPAIQSSHKDLGTPPIEISPADSAAVAAYIRSVLETIGGQGKPPALGLPAPSIVVGDAGAGRTYFAAKCASCHSATADMQGIATRFPDPVVLQNRWVAGGGRFGRSAASVKARTVTAAVTLASGELLEGRLVRIDDFFVTIGLDDGSTRTIHRNGSVPKIEFHDPMKAHRDLLTVLTDKDMHNVTAYLVTLK